MNKKSILEKNARIVITGGTGLIGSYIIRYLLKEGFTNLLGIKRPDSPLQLFSKSERAKVEWIDADIKDIVGLEPAIETAEYVFHCAGLVSFSPKAKKELIAVNQIGTANIVNLCLEHGVKKLVYTSSTSAIGRPPKNNTIRESNKWEGNSHLSQYAISKYLGEMEVWRGNAEGLETVILNPSTVLGGGFWHTGPQKLFNLSWKSFKYYPSGTTGLVDVRDVAKLHIQAMQSAINGQRYIICGENVSYQSLMEQIAAGLNTAAPSKKIKKWMQQLIWRIEAIKSVFSKQPPFLTQETVAITNQNYLYENRKSKEAFGFSYTPIEQTIREMTELFKQAKKDKAPFSRMELRK